MGKRKPMTDRMLADAIALAHPGEASSFEIMLCPWGDVKSSKGDFVVDEESAKLVIRAFADGKKPIPIDYEHTTVGGEYATASGAAPASGWITAITSRPGEGIFATVEWTAKARDMIQSDEYRYLSPVLSVRKSDHKVVAVSSAALTNKPAILDMMRVAAKEDSIGDESMDLKKLRAALAAAGITLAEDADDATVLTATEAFVESAVTAKSEPPPLAAVAAKLGLDKDATVETIAAKVTELQTGKVDASEYKALKDRLETIEATARQREAKGLVALGIETAKLNPNNEAQMKWARTQADADTVAFRAFLDAAPTLYTPGKIVTPSKSLDSADDRSTVISLSAKEYDADPTPAMGARKESWVNAALVDAGMSRLNDKELKAVIG